MNIDKMMFIAWTIMLSLLVGTVVMTTDTARTTYIEHEMVYIDYGYKDNEIFMALLKDVDGFIKYEHKPKLLSLRIPTENMDEFLRGFNALVDLENEDMTFGEGLKATGKLLDQLME